VRPRKKLGCWSLGSTTLAKARSFVREPSVIDFVFSFAFPDMLKLGEVTVAIPKIAFNVESVQYKSVTFNCWDMGGRNSYLRPFWRHYYRSTQGVIFLVDSNGRDRIGDAASELEEMMSEDALKDCVLLVLANKQDLPNAMSVRGVAEGLRLRELRRRAWHVHGTCATVGDGLYEGLDWLMHAIKFGRK
jgi:ADP-ribosylation factor protein 1